MNISPAESIRLSLGAVWTHRFRSFLTILGIVIGITTVVVVASLLSGVRSGIVAFFQELGPDNIFVTKAMGPPGMGGMTAKERRRRPLRPEYAEAIKQWCPATIEDAGLQLFVSPGRGGQSLVAKVPGYETDSLSVAGQTANYNRLSPRELASGRFFTEEEARRAQRVAVLGSAVAEALFPGGGAVGRPVNVNGAEYVVTGVFAKAKGSFLGENQMDSLIVIPLETLRIRYPQLNDYQLVLRARPGKRDDAVAEAEAALRRLRQLPPGAENDFVLNTPEQIIEQFDSITGVVGVAAIALSSLGLLVGGIGVMNIMLVSVTERTREIGVRKAVGARRMDIVGQFLIEAVALTATGGVLGVLAAAAISAAVGALVPALPSAVPAWAVGAGLSVSMAVGLFFGVWPAVKASRMDPVEALRHE